MKNGTIVLLTNISDWGRKMLKLKCFYNCRCCAARFDKEIETEEQLKTIIDQMGGYNFMFHPHKCDEDEDNFESRIGVSDLIYFEIVK